MKRFACLATLLIVTAPLGAQEKASLEKPTVAWTIPWDADWVTAVTFLGDAPRIAAANRLGDILIFDLANKGDGPFPPPLRRLEGHTNMVSALAASPDGRWLYSSSYDHTVRVWDLQTPAKSKGVVVLKSEKAKQGKTPEKTEFPVEIQDAHKSLTAHKEWVRSISLSQDGKQLLTGDDKGTAIVWQVPDGQELRRWQVKGWLQAVALSADANVAATCECSARYADFPNANRLWNATAAKEKLDLSKTLQRDKGKNNVIPIHAARFSKDGKYLALGEAGERDGFAKVFLLDAADGKKLNEMNGHQFGVTALAFHPDGKHLASSGRDTTVRIWRIADGKHVADIGKGRGGQFQDWIHSIAISADGTLLACADMAGHIQVWRVGQK